VRSSRFAFALWVAAGSLLAGAAPGCTGGGGGTFHRGEAGDPARRQVLSVEPAGAVGAVELALPFDSSLVDPSTITVTLLDPGSAPADTRLDFSVTEVPSIVRVGVVTAQEGGFPPQGGIRLAVSYRAFSGQLAGRGFSEPARVVKALDADFQTRPCQVRCAWQE